MSPEISMLVSTQHPLKPVITKGLIPECSDESSSSPGKPGRGQGDRTQLKQPREAPTGDFCRQMRNCCKTMRETPDIRAMPGLAAAEVMLTAAENWTSNSSLLLPGSPLSIHRVNFAHLLTISPQYEDRPACKGT